jgi:hypothetical protein
MVTAAAGIAAFATLAAVITSPFAMPIITAVGKLRARTLHSRSRSASSTMAVLNGNRGDQNWPQTASGS